MAGDILDEFGGGESEEEIESSKLRKDGTYIYGDDKITYYNPDLPSGPSIWDYADGNFDLLVTAGGFLFFILLFILCCACRAIQETRNYTKNRVH